MKRAGELGPSTNRVAGGPLAGELARWRPPKALLPISTLALATACPAGEPPAPEPRATPEACQALRARYRERWDAHQRCTEDADCAAELRDGPHRGLDPGCVRNGPWLARYATDPVALDYAVGGCAADADEVCEAVPAKAMCRANRCVERPPADVPPTWTLAAGGKGKKQFRFFVPPELKETALPVEDDYARLWNSDRLAVAVHIDHHGKREPLVTDPSHQRLSRTEVRTSGVAAELVVELAPPGTFGGKPDAWTSTVLHARELGAGGPVFSLAVHCKGPVVCEEAKTIVGSLTLTP